MRILDASLGSVTTWEQSGDDVTIRETTDVTAAVERAKALHNEGFHATKGGQKHVAEIPVAALVQWCQRYGYTYGEAMRDKAVMRRFLQDPDNSAFRIWKGRL